MAEEFVPSREQVHEWLDQPGVREEIKARLEATRARMEEQERRNRDFTSRCRCPGFCYFHTKLRSAPDA